MHADSPTIDCLAAFINGWFLGNTNNVSDIELWNDFQIFIQSGADRGWAPRTLRSTCYKSWGRALPAACVW